MRGASRAPLPLNGHRRVQRPVPRPVYRVSCAWCSAPLADERGNPRWHITFQWEFVCVGFCAWPMRPSVAGRAA